MLDILNKKPLLTPDADWDEFSDNYTKVEEVFEAWIAAQLKRDVQKAVDLYHPEAVMLATFAPEPILSQQGRASYFTNLMANENLSVTIDKGYLRTIGENGAVACGLYTFSFDKDGQHVEVPARYSFVYRYENGEWLIVAHHSSRVPTPN